MANAGPSSSWYHLPKGSGRGGRVIRPRPHSRCPKGRASRWRRRHGRSYVVRGQRRRRGPPRVGLLRMMIPVCSPPPWCIPTERFLGASGMLSSMGAATHQAAVRYRPGAVQLCVQWHVQSCGRSLGRSPGTTGARAKPESAVQACLLGSAGGTSRHRNCRGRGIR